MPLLETLISDVAPQIAKSILRFWLKDQEWSEDITSGFIDIIHNRTKDARIRKRAERQFEEISERVIDNLALIFKSEDQTFDENKQTLIAQAVADTFRGARIDTRLLIEQNLSPNKLYRHILQVNPEPTKTLSTPERQLCERVLEESCICIIDIASQLPAFSERAFAEILSRETQLLNATNHILQEVRRIRRNISRNSDFTDNELFETDYRWVVARNLDHLELFGLDVTGVNRRHSLSVAYITLTVQSSQLTTQKNRPVEMTIEGESRGKDLSNMLKNTPVTEALAQTKRVLIRGLAGSGKTTLLQWIAVNSAVRSFSDQMAGWNDTVPFFVRLRDFVDNKLPTPNEFPALISPAVAEDMPEKWVRDCLKAGRGIVLVDGVDEIPEAQRLTVRNWLSDIVNTYHQSRYVITSRPSAVEEEWLLHEGFINVELQPMSIADIDQFVDHWHNAIRKELQSKPERDELTQYSTSIKSDIRKSSALGSGLHQTEASMR